ncbi:MAG: hypothetical protein MUF40_05695, partial [Gemmatimonadaceae bacterium]|nr:hypothetical protein [Gemmatimonadaceae bacterium]
MPAPRHLVAVWNPAYAGDGMDAHLRLLVAAAQAARRDPEIPDEDVCVYWGQVRSRNRQQRYPYDDQIAALAAELTTEAPAPRELQLYLTDYRTLYVCHVDLILAGDEVDAEEQRDYAPDYYARTGLRVDWWFRLRDARRLVHDDLEAVIAQLARLRNVNYGGRPVSLYGGMVDLPIVVERDDGITWFDP